MVKEKVKGQEQAQVQKPVMISYTEAEVNYQEDLLGKLMTLDHIRGMLTSSDPPAFVQHLEEIKEEYRLRYRDFIAFKKQGGFMQTEEEAAAAAEQGTGENPDEPAAAE